MNHLYLEMSDLRLPMFEQSPLTPSNLLKSRLNDDSQDTPQKEETGMSMNSTNKFMIDKINTNRSGSLNVG